MIIQDTFEIEAEPERVYSFLLDVHNVASCVRGAELVKINEDESYEGRIKMKVGPITAGYSGVARIVERDDAGRRAVLRAEGKETKGAGTAVAMATMSVEPTTSGSRVVLSTEFEVAGRLAQFGRGIMEDVSAKMVRDMASNVRTALLAPPAEAAEGTSASSATTSHPVPEPVVTATRSAVRAERDDSAVRVLPLAWTVVVGWFRRRFRRGAR
jgi:carbon monoxide dehydrogenase subunit G